MRSVAIVGGGAAGLAAAVAASERGFRVTVYEADERVGRSILATGNGRCNFSNARLQVSEYHNEDFVREAFSALGEAAGIRETDEAVAASAVWRFFAQHGLQWRTEDDGRMYPASLKASTVLDVLRFSAAAAGARVCCGMPIASIEPPRAAGKPFTLRTRDGEFKRADNVIVAVGGTVARDLLAGRGCSAGFLPQRPVLGPLATETDAIRGLDNTRVRMVLTLSAPDGTVKACERGELLFRKYGVSGIAVFNLSRSAQPGDMLSIDLLNGAAGDAAVRELFAERCRSLSAVYPRLTAEEFFRGLFTPNVAEAVCRQAGVPYEAPLSEALSEASAEGNAERNARASEQLAALARTASAFTLAVRGIGDARQCQVHRGGIAVQDVDPRTMQLRAVPGLAVAGEALDVDGPCGGYNLHWAWASGLLAACALDARDPIENS